MLERRGRIPVAESVRYILQVATGLEHAATRGVVHRDVKPSNIIITPTGRAKLVDMGLARNLERKGEADLTQSGVTLGTFDYISPEQALEPREADARSDIYSLGCTLYHMLTGQPPAPEGTPAKKLHHHQYLQPIDPRQIDPVISDDIVGVLGKMMAKNPDDRYQRPIHLVHHLMQIARKVGVADDLPEGMLMVDAPLPNRPHSRPFLMIGMALAALAAVTLLLSFAPQPQRPVVGPQVVDAKKAVAPPATGGPDKNSDAPPAPEPVRPDVVKNAAELQAALKNHTGSVTRVKIEGKITLDGKEGLSYLGRKDHTLIVEPQDEDGFASISFSYRSDGSPEAGLILDGAGEVIFKRIKFQINAANTPEKAVAAVLIRGADRVTADQCVFAQTIEQSMLPKRIPIASILIDSLNEGEATTAVILKRCCFEGMKSSWRPGCGGAEHAGQGASGQLRLSASWRALPRSPRDQAYRRDLEPLCRPHHPGPGVSTSTRTRPLKFASATVFSRAPSPTAFSSRSRGCLNPT